MRRAQSRTGRPPSRCSTSPTSTPRSTSSLRRHNFGTHSKRSGPGGPSFRPTERRERRRSSRSRSSSGSTTHSRVAAEPHGLVGGRDPRLPRHPGLLRPRLPRAPALELPRPAPGRARSRALAAGSRSSDFDVPANFAKLAAVTLLAFYFLELLRDRGVGHDRRADHPWVDAYSVWRGPTKHIVTHQRELSRRSRSPSRSPGENTAQLGLPDLLFFALFLGAAARWGLRTRLTWVAMALSFGATMALTVYFDLNGLPALPLLAFGFLVPNADLLWRKVRAEDAWGSLARAGEAVAAFEERDRLDVRRVREHVDGPGALEPVAPLGAELLDVPGQRRRVARDVDDPLRPRGARSGAAPSRRAPRAEGRRRRRRASRAFAEVRDHLADLAAKNAAFVIPFRSAFSSAHATDSSETSTPQTVSASRASVSPIVPIPQ